MSDLIPTAFPPGVFIAEEMVERGWNKHDLAHAMGDELAINLCLVEFLLHYPDKSMQLDEEA